MKIVNIDDARFSSDSKDLLKIKLDLQNLNKFPIQILYYKEQGFKEFIIEYDFNSIKLPMSKVADKIRENMLVLVKNHDIIIYVKGFTKCIFEKNIITPGLKWNYEDKILYASRDFLYENNKPEHGLEKCKDCIYSNCHDVSDEYVDKFNDEEFEPFLSNKYISEELYEKEITNFSNEEMRNYYEKILKDFKEEKEFNRKRIVFVKSYPKEANHGYKERFVYYIYNKKQDIQDSLSFAKSFISEKFLEENLSLLEKSYQIVLSFALMNDGKIRKTLYYNLDKISDEEKEFLRKKYELKIDEENIWGIGFDFKDEELYSKKIYYEHKKIKSEDVKKFFNEFPLSQKMTLLRFLNFSMTKPIEGVLLDKKFNKQGEIISKRVDISMQHNQYKIRHISKLFPFDIGYLDGKENYTISFEIRMDEPEKINFYFSPKMQPKEEEPMQEL